MRKFAGLIDGPGPELLLPPKKRLYVAVKHPCGEIDTRCVDLNADAFQRFERLLKEAESHGRNPPPELLHRLHHAYLEVQKEVNPVLLEMIQDHVDFE
jgi:hypothetical protein